MNERGKEALSLIAEAIVEKNTFAVDAMFAIQGDALVYNAAGSDAFPYVKVAEACRAVCARGSCAMNRKVIWGITIV